jgi:DNA-directed RNA polymerase subunit beta
MKILIRLFRMYTWDHSLHDPNEVPFVINGAERVVVSQLHRSPGVFFGQSLHANGTKLYSARIIPFKGSWIEFATDINNVMYAYIDRKKKLPVTTFYEQLVMKR